MDSMSLRQLREMVKDRETWYNMVHVVAESDTTVRLNNITNSTQYALFELSQFNLHNSFEIDLASPSSTFTEEGTEP